MNTTIYKLKPVLGRKDLSCLATDDLQSVTGGRTVLSDFDPGVVTSRDWKAKQLAPVWRERRVINPLPGQVNDYPCLGLSVPTFSERAVEALREFLEPNGEILPLLCDFGKYYAYNVTTVADVLDLSRSTIKWFEIDILKKRTPIVAKHIARYEFQPAGLEGLSIFRIPQSVTEYYVTDRFAKRVLEYGLQGFSFEKVWPTGPARGPSGIAELERRAGIG